MFSAPTVVSVVRATRAIAKANSGQGDTDSDEEEQQGGGGISLPMDCLRLDAAGAGGHGHVSSGTGLTRVLPSPVIPDKSAFVRERVVAELSLLHSSTPPGRPPSASGSILAMHMAGKVAAFVQQQVDRLCTEQVEVFLTSPPPLLPSAESSSLAAPSTSWTRPRAPSWSWPARAAASETCPSPGSSVASSWRQWTT